MVQNLFAAAEMVDMPLVFDGSDQLTGDFGIYDDPGLPQLEHTLQRFPKLKIFGHGPVSWAEFAKLSTPGERGVVFNFKGDSQCFHFPLGKIEGEGVVPILMRRYENLYADLSDGTPIIQFKRDLEYTAKFFNEFQDRLFFGTDYCNINVLAMPYLSFFLEMRDNKVISQEVFDKVMYKNAAKLLGL